MGSVHVLRTDAVEIHDGVVAMLKEALADAEAGEIVAFALTAILANGSTSTYVPRTQSIATLIGAVNMTLLEITAEAIGPDRTVNTDEMN